MLELAFLFVGVGGIVLGYALATHVHSIANAAAARISHIGMAAGPAIGTIEPPTK